jgi:hypothetical protein
MNSRFFFLLFVMTLSLCFAQANPLSLASESEVQLNNPLKSPEEMRDVIPYLLGIINWSRIRDHVSFFEKLDTRFTGYPGYYKAQDYIVKSFKEFGLKVSLMNYSIVIPYDYGAQLRIPSKNMEFRIYPLLPNLICPPSTPGLKGPLVYVGKGSFEEMMGKLINGSIVIIEFNSYRNWLNSVLFGAKAIVFVEPEDTTIFEAESKVISAPVNIPRYYMKRKDAELLLAMLKSGECVEGEIFSLMRWERREVSNVIGVLEGVGKKDEAIAIWAYFDSGSVVPSIAPGADAATGVSVLLELARIFSEKRPYRTIIFVALSGHFQGLWGARELIDKFYFSSEAKNVVLTIGLDLSTDSNTMGLYYGGINFFYSADFDPTKFYRISDLLFYLGKRSPFPDDRYQDMEVGDQSLLGVLMAVTGRVYYVGDGTLQRDGVLLRGLASTPVGLMLDTEPLAMANGIAFSFSTSNSYRIRWETPLDTIKYWKLENLKPQAEFIVSAIYLFANLENLKEWVPETSLTRFDPIRFFGFSTLRGKIMEFDLFKGTYIPVPHAIVYAEAPFFRHRFVAMADDKGEFVIVGLKPRGFYSVQAFVVDEATGNPIYAPDMGEYATGFASSFTVSRDVEFKTFIVFKCGSLGLVGVLEPRTKSALNIHFSILDAYAHTPPLSYGYALGSSFTLTQRKPASLETHVSVIFVPPEGRFEVVMKVGREVFGVINNGGSGYGVGAGEMIRIDLLPLRAAMDLHKLNSERLALLHKYGIFSGGRLAESFSAKSEALIELAVRALYDLDYGRARSYSIEAWANEVVSYLETRALVMDIVSATVFISFLLAPFAMSAERLFVYSQRGVERLIATLIAFLVPCALFFIIHPGFALAPSAFIAVLGVSILVLFAPLVTILLSEVFEYVSEVRERLIGRHEVGVSRVSTFLLAISVGIGNMRRRKIRTGLTLTTVVITVFGLVALTSIFSMKSIVSAPQPGIEATLYEGLLLRDTKWNPLDRGLWESLKTRFESDAVASPRAWWFPSHREPPRLILYNSTPVLALWGLMPEEDRVSGLWSKAKVKGRWLTEGDEWVCIVSDDIFRKAGLKLNDKLEIMGLTFEVVGVIDGKAALQLLDLDGEPITPLDFETLMQKLGEEEVFPHLSHSFIIVPFETLLRLGGQIYSIAIKIEDPLLLEKTVNEMVFFATTDVYVSSRGRTLVYRVGTAFAFMGAEFLMVPIVLAVITIMNTTLGNLYERMRELSIYSSLGLSPTQAGGMYLVENVIYAFIGGFLGYTCGILGIKLFQIIGAVPPDFSPNFFGSMVVYSVLAAMASAVVASAYPFLKVSRLVTPSLERKWKAGSPSGDKWEVELPFRLPSEEVQGLLMFLKEYFEAHSQEGIGYFITRKDPIIFETEISGKKALVLEVYVSLAPYEQGINQKVTLKALSTPEGRYSFEMEVKRLTGSYSVWRRLNYRFMDGVRKQFLLWRSLPPSQRQKYRERGVAYGWRTQ